MPLKQDTKYDVQNHESQTANPLIRYLVLTFVILIGCSAVWRLAIYQTDVERGLAELRLANRKSRTLESRLSGIDHSPWTIVRGDKAETSTEPLNRAENILTMASTETGDPSSTAALGKVYLATGKFEQANSLFERASHTDKNNAEIYSDWGASLLELGKIKRVSGERAKSVELFDQALGRLDNAIKLVPGSLEDRFNRALCLESLYLAEEAKKA